MEYAKEAMDQISGGGAFLTVKGENRVNTMTIGWAFLGFIWGKPIMMVAVRHSRFTYELLKESQEFSVSIPIHSDLKKALGFCGTKSGRHYDKFEECGLTLVPGETIKTPYIQQCDLHYECRIVYRQSMDSELVQHPIVHRYYDQNDYHVIYYGEILACHT